MSEETNTKETKPTYPEKKLRKEFKERRLKELTEEAFNEEARASYVKSVMERTVKTINKLTESRDELRDKAEKLKETKKKADRKEAKILEGQIGVINKNIKTLEQKHHTMQKTVDNSLEVAMEKRNFRDDMIENFVV